MADKRLVNYIRNSVKRGYSIGQIKTYLFNQGYNVADIDAAAKEAGFGGPGKKHLVVFAMFAIAILIIAGGGFFFVIKPKYFPSGPQEYEEKYREEDDGITGIKVEDEYYTELEEDKQYGEQIDKVSDSDTGGFVYRRDNTLKPPEPIPVPEQPVERELPNSMSDCGTWDDKEECVKELAFVKNDRSLCDRIKYDVDIKDKCYQTNALQNENKQACELVDNSYNKEVCKLLLRVAEILKEQDTEYTIDARAGKIYYDHEQAFKALQKYYKQYKVEQFRLLEKLQGEIKK